MANKKISELPSATTPLSGVEEMEIVQGGINKKVAVEEAGLSGGVQAISGDGVDNTDPQNPVITINPYTYPFPQFTTATSTTAYTGTPSPVISAYATGQKFQVKIHATSTGASTLNLNSVGAKKVFVNPTTQATTGDLLINQIYIFAYDAALDTAAGGFLMIGSGGGPDGWLVTGTTNLTGDTIIDNGAHNLLIGEQPGPFIEYDMDGTGYLAIPNSNTFGLGDPVSTEHAYIRHAIDPGNVVETYIEITEGSEQSAIAISAGTGVSNIELNSTGQIILTAGAFGEKMQIKGDGSIHLEGTVTSGGTTGAQTINRMTGSVNFAAAATTLVVTNSIVTTSSIIFCTILTDDSTAVLKNVVPASGSFTIKMATAPTAETRVGFLVIKII